LFLVMIVDRMGFDYGYVATGPPRFLRDAIRAKEEDSARQKGSDEAPK